MSTESNYKLTPEALERFLGEQQQIIEHAKSLAERYDQLLKDTGKSGYMYVGAVDYADTIEIDAEEVSFSGYDTRSQDNEYFTIPTAFLIDPDGFEAQAREEYRIQQEAQAKEKARQASQRRRDQEKREREQLEQLVAKYGLPQAGRGAEGSYGLPQNGQPLAQAEGPRA